MADPQRVALTFDTEHPDRPAAPANDERLLDVLDDLGVRATFFVQGRWAEAHPATSRRIATAGHLVGSHGFYHVRMPLLTDEGLASDIARAEAAVRAATGVDPRPWFRCPFGSGARDPRVLATLEAAGYRHVGWTFDTQDWDAAPAVDDLPGEIAAAVRGVQDAIVLFHSWPDRALAALPRSVARLRDSGANLVRVDQLAVVRQEPTDRP